MADLWERLREKPAKERTLRALSSLLHQRRMVSPDQTLGSEAKIEIDIAEDQGHQWTTQGQSSGGTWEWSENNVTDTITITPFENNNSSNPSAHALKSDPDRYAYRGRGIKAEPADDCTTRDTVHRFPSADEREGERSYVSYGCCDSPYSASNSRNAANSDKHSTQSVGYGRAEVDFEVNFDCQGRAVRTKIIGSEVIKTEQRTVVQMESVSEDTTTVTVDGTVGCHFPSSCRYGDQGRAAGDIQKLEPLRSVKEEPQDESPAVYSTVQPMSDNTSGSLLLSLNTSHVCQRCSATFVLFSSLELHTATFHGETLYDLLPVFSTSACDVVAIAVCVFNDGANTLGHILEKLGLSVGLFTERFLHGKDTSRILTAQRRAHMATKEYRRRKRLQRLGR
ncbi:hypothetical protein ACOMHN_030087 [Nucella lapillus]